MSLDIFDQSNSCEVPAGGQQRSLVGSIEPGGVNRAGQIRHEHSVPLDVQRDADSFHQMCDQYLGSGTPRSFRIHWGAVDGIAARRIASVGPVEDVILEIKFQVDRLGKVIEEQLNVGAVRGTLPFGNFDARAENAALARIIRSFLRPVDLSAIGINCDSHAPFCSIVAGPRVVNVTQTMHTTLNIMATRSS
jgi:hypothetical protein